MLSLCLVDGSAGTSVEGSPRVRLESAGATTYPMLLSTLQVYAALFGTAFLAATILPAQSELLFAYLLRSGEYDWRILFAAATAGNVLGSVVNWVLGRMIERFRDRRWFPVDERALERAQRWYGRWGKWSLLLSWAPIIGDALTLIAGALRTPLTTFLPLVLIAKAGRYCVIVLAVVGTLPG